MQGAPVTLGAAYHHLLLRLAGWAPDEMVYQAREWLAQERLVAVAQTVVYILLSNRIPATQEDADLLRTTYAEAGLDTDALGELETVSIPEMPWVAMCPAFPRPQVDVDDAPSCVDLTVGPADHPDLDAVDRAAVAAVADGVDGAAVQALWRAWRGPAIASPWPSPRRLYLALVDAPGERLPIVTSSLHRALRTAGDTTPQVEVFADIDDLPPYQRTALGCSALLWTAQPPRPIHIAGLFDDVAEVGGPGFAGSRSTLAQHERDKVLRFLDQGSPVLVTTTLMDDVMDAKRHAAVPMSFRTDGHWVWCDAAGYYLREYGLAPDPGLLSHVRDRRYESATVDAVARHRAMAALQAYGSEDDEPPDPPPGPIRGGPIADHRVGSDDR